MLQLYHVALTAGKAHKDHKHHHAHHFKHDGSPLDANTEEAPTEPPPPEPTPIGNGNFLIGGQIQTRPNLNLAASQQQQQQILQVQQPNGLQLQQQFLNGQLGNRLVSEQLLNSIQASGHIPVPVISDNSVGQQYSIHQPPKTTVVLSGSLLNPANVQFIDDTATHNIFRRDSKKRDKRDNPEKELKEETSSGMQIEKKRKFTVSHLAKFSSFSIF